jgi:hypothetical protein
LHQTAFGINVDLKEGEKQRKGTRDHEHHSERQSRVQPPERPHGEDDRAEPDQPSSDDRSQRIINYIRAERGGEERNHEEGKEIL